MPRAETKMLIDKDSPRGAIGFLRRCGEPCHGHVGAQFFGPHHGRVLNRSFFEVGGQLCTDVPFGALCLEETNDGVAQGGVVPRMLQLFVLESNQILRGRNERDLRDVKNKGDKTDVRLQVTEWTRRTQVTLAAVLVR
jgi:hypothetical protein